MQEFKSVTALPKGPAFLWFSASWCAPCKKVDVTTLTERADELHVPVFHCDIDAHPEAADAFGVSSIPAFIAVRDGVAIASPVTGPTTQSWLRLLKLLK